MPPNRELFHALRRHPGMFVSDHAYWEVCAFVLGYDMARDGGSLAGFREWLVLRLGFGANLGWSALVLYLAFPSSDDHRTALDSHGKNDVAIETPFALLDEFDQATAGIDALPIVFAEYATRFIKDHARS